MEPTLRMCIAALAVAALLAGCSDGSDEPSPTVAQHDHQAGTATPTNAGSEPVSHAESGLEVRAAYVREPAPGQPVVAAFATIANHGDSVRVLESVASPVAETVELHNTVDSDGVMSMRRVAQVAIQPHEELALEPGGYHLMLSEVERRLEAGQQVPLEFRFEGGIHIEVTAPVHAL